MARILIADDETDLRELLRTVLTFDDHDITLAADGEAAVEQLAAGPVDLMLLDVMMPRRDGWWVLEQVKSSEAWSEIPIVMLTARADDLDRIQGAIGGAIRYVTKPFSVSELRRTIIEVLAGPPEHEQRRLAQRQALVDLVRLENSLPPPKVAPARPRLTRLDGPGHATMPPRPDKRVRVLPSYSLSNRQRTLVAAAVVAPSIRDAADSLAVSRSYMYASLGRIAEKVGLANGPELIRRVRSGELTLS